MIDTKTDHLGLTLPHEQNDLDDDVLRIRAAFRRLDEFAKATDDTLAARLAQAVAADDAIATLLLRMSAAELAQAELDSVQAGHGQKITALEQRSFFGVCDTAGDEAAKQLELPGFALAPGVALDIIFEEVNAAEDLTLAINDGEPKPVLVSGVAPEPGNLAKGQIYSLKYSGTAWQILAGMAKDSIGQTAWFEDTRPRPGYVPLNGCTIESFSALWPQMAVYLSTEHGQARCFETLAEREAAHVAIWHTLASGATVGWGGLGGVTRFFWDQGDDLLYMPDLRGMIRTMAGDGVVAPNMGEGLGDRVRPVTGSLHIASPCLSSYAAGQVLGTGALEGVVKEHPNSSFQASGNSRKIVEDFFLSTSRVTSTGASNIPRSWGSLACAYFGQPSA